MLGKKQRDVREWEEHHASDVADEADERGNDDRGGAEGFEVM